MIKADAISYAYRNGPVLQDVSLSLSPGDLTAVIGPNGSGKTTLLRLLSGAARPRSGSVLLDERSLAQVSHRELALQIAMVPQELDLPFPFTVRELVEMGRTPHRQRGWLAALGPQDTVAVEAAMAAMGVLPLAHRAVNELSGGERQRAVIAMALAQEPRYLLLDEPTTHLDIQHQLEILELLTRLNRERGLAVLATMHDLNLASLYFDRLVLLDRGRVATSGTPSEVISESRLADVFHAGVQVTRHPVTGAPLVVVLPTGATAGTMPRADLSAA